MVSPAYTLKRGLTHGRRRKVDKSLTAAGEKIPDLYMTWQTTIFEKMHKVAHLDTLRLDHILHPYYGFICTNFYLQMTKYTIWLIKKEKNTFFIIKKTQYTICTCIQPVTDVCLPMSEACLVWKQVKQYMFCNDWKCGGCTAQATFWELYVLLNL